jgi:hypothetical protein
MDLRRRLPVTDPDAGRLAGIVTRSGLLRLCLCPCEEIRAEIEAEVLPRVPGAYPRWLTVVVRDGVVTIWGRAGRKSAAPGEGRVTGRGRDPGGRGHHADLMVAAPRGGGLVLFTLVATRRRTS